jgi:hypothetical protein
VAGSGGEMSQEERPHLWRSTPLPTAKNFAARRFYIQYTHTEHTPSNMFHAFIFSSSKAAILDAKHRSFCRAF